MELQEDIKKLVGWANTWQMSFNIDKCSMMHILHNNVQNNYNMSNLQLPTTDQQRDLGIIITKDLKWQKQTEKSCKTANRVLGFIARNFRYKNKELILPLYKSLIRKHGSTIMTLMTELETMEQKFQYISSPTLLLNSNNFNLEYPTK